MKRILLSVLLAFSIIARAEDDAPQMDAATQNSLITKLETILPQFSDDKAKTNTLQLRLADLYSDRARLKDFEANEKNCQDCKEGDKDRKTAIAYYEKAKTSAPKESQSHILLQLAHLFKMTDQTTKAKKTFDEIVSKKSDKAFISKAHLGLGDIAFEKGEFKNAKKEYVQAANTTDTEDKIYCDYRLAWVEINLGNPQGALKHIQASLKLARENKKTSWFKDLMNDYATILCHLPFGPREIDEYVAFSEPTEASKNLKFLGQEADRLGNKKGSLLIWTQYNSQEKNAEGDKAELQLKLAENFYDLNDYRNSLAHLDLVVAAILKDKCEDCKKVIADFKAFIVSWSKKEKSEPSASLVQAYDKLLSVSGNDYAVTVWAAQIARAGEKYKDAINFYEKAARIAIHNSKQDDIESTTSSMLEIGTEANDKAIYTLALTKYLELNPNGKQRQVVKFELAQSDYENKKYVESASEFESLATDSSWGSNASDKKLKLQSADLSIESNAKLSKSDDIRRLSKVYAKSFSDQSTHFSEVGRRVTINKLAVLTTTKQSSDSEIKNELSNLEEYPNGKLDKKDQIAQFKTEILAAMKINDSSAVEKASLKLLSVKAATKSDQELANKCLLWVYTNNHDTKNAYKYALRIPEKDLTNENRVLMIRNSKHPWQEFARQRSHLSRSPDLLAEIALELHFQSPNLNEIASVLKVPRVKSTFEGSYMQKLFNRIHYQHFLSSTRSISQTTMTEHNFQKTIKIRVKYLKSLQDQYKFAVGQNDLPLQLTVLNSIYNENSKFHKQLLALPTPKGLKNKEKAMYRGMLSQQARPFLTTADEASKTMANFFADNSKAMSELKSALSAEDICAKIIAKNELKLMKPYMSGTRLAYLGHGVALNQSRARR